MHSRQKAITSQGHSQTSKQLLGSNGQKSITIRSCISPKSLRYCRTCAVGSDGPQATQHPNHIAVHRSSNLGNRDIRSHKQGSKSVRLLELLLRSTETHLTKSNRAHGCSRVATHSGQLLQQAVHCARHLALKLRHHLQQTSDTINNLLLYFTNDDIIVLDVKTQYRVIITHNSKRFTKHNTNLLSPFMQSFPSGVVAKTRPHLVHFLHVWMKSIDLSLKSMLFKNRRCLLESSPLA